jgi:hypothetical protein
MVIDYIDQAIQESTQDINTFRSEGRMDTASSLEKIDSAFAELDMEEVHRLQSEEISKLDADKAVIYANVGTKFYAVFEI